MRKSEHIFQQLLSTNQKSSAHSKSQQLLIDLCTTCITQIQVPLNRWICYLFTFIGYMQLVGYFYLTECTRGERIDLAQFSYRDLLRTLHFLSNPTILLYNCGELGQKLIQWALIPTALLIGYVVGYAVVATGPAGTDRLSRPEREKGGTTGDFFFRLLLTAFNAMLVIPLLQVCLLNLLAVGGQNGNDSTGIQSVQAICAALLLAATCGVSLFIELFLSFSLTFPEINMCRNGYSKQGVVDLALKAASILLFSFNFFWGQANSTSIKAGQYILISLLILMNAYKQLNLRLYYDNLRGLTFLLTLCLAFLSLNQGMARFLFYEGPEGSHPLGYFLFLAPAAARVLFQLWFSKKQALLFEKLVDEPDVRTSSRTRPWTRRLQ